MENMGNDHKEKGDNSAACVIRDTDLIDQKNCPKIIHLLKNIEHTVRRLERDCKKMKADLRTVKWQQLQAKKQIEEIGYIVKNKTPIISNQCVVKPTLPDSGVDECIHGEVLQENIMMLVQDVDLSHGLIMDEMFQTGILTDNENQELREENRPNKIRLLASILARKNKGKFQEFLSLVAKEEFYPHIGEKLNVAYEAKKKEKEKHLKCIRCFIIEKVNIQQIQDHLCEKRVIGLQEMYSLIKRDKTKDHIWQEIFKKLSHPELGKIYVNIFKESLQENYSHIAKRIASQSHLNCVCGSAELSYPSGSEGSVSERSTTTTIIPEVNIHENLQGLQQTSVNKNESKFSTTTKTIQESNTYELRNIFESTSSIRNVSSESFIPKSNREWQHEHHSNGSDGGLSDISTSTVVPKPKPETFEWIQRHHNLSEDSLVIQNEDSAPTCYLHPVNKDETFLPHTFIKSQNGIIDFEGKQSGFKVRNNHQPYLKVQENPFKRSREIRSDINDPMDRKRKSADEISSASLAHKRANLSFKQTECYSNLSTDQRMGCLEIKNHGREINIHSKMFSLL